MRISPLLQIYQCTFDEIVELVDAYGLLCCEPAGAPFIALRFPHPNAALAFKLALPTAAVADDVADLSSCDVSEAEEALDQLNLHADRFDFLEVWV